MSFRKPPPRYAPNRYANAPLCQSCDIFDASGAWQQVQAMLPELQECTERGGVPQSTGHFTRNYTVYTGLAGVALAFLKLGQHCLSCRKDAASAKTFIQQASDTASLCLRGDRRSSTVSFFCGTPGYLAILCVSSKLQGDLKSASTYLQELLGWTESALRHKDDELLFGRAGYLYALLFVRDQLDGSLPDEGIQSALAKTSERLVECGQRYATSPAYRQSGWPLMWECFNEPYLGAAHGHIGILAMLFQTYDLLSPRSRTLVVQTLEKILSIRYKSGNVPIILGDNSDVHVHWCHGAPGVPTLMAAAAAAVGDEQGRYRNAALQAANVVWERGVILKGNGLCHGIAGNGYTFLTTYRLTGDSTQLDQAKAFGALLNDRDLQLKISKQPDPQRKVVGKPDSPRSLMEGTAGVLCFLLDLCAPETSAFPAWELSNRRSFTNEAATPIMSEQEASSSAGYDVGTREKKESGCQVT